jgi:hypothetical protein
MSGASSSPDGSSSSSASSSTDISDSLASDALATTDGFFSVTLPIFMASLVLGRAVSSQSYTLILNDAQKFQWAEKGRDKASNIWEVQVDFSEGRRQKGYEVLLKHDLWDVQMRVTRWLWTAGRSAGPTKETESELG